MKHSINHGELTLAFTVSKDIGELADMKRLARYIPDGVTVTLSDDKSEFIFHQTVEDGNIYVFREIDIAEKTYDALVENIVNSIVGKMEPIDSDKELM